MIIILISNVLSSSVTFSIRNLYSIIFHLVQKHRFISFVCDKTRSKINLNPFLASSLRHSASDVLQRNDLKTVEG